jgi:hypothetical protein
MSASLKYLITWIQSLSIDQWGLILNFIGGLMMAIDLAGRNRVDRLERAVLKRFANAKNRTNFILHVTRETVGAIVSSWRVVLLVLLFPAAILLCRIILPWTGESGFFHVIVLELWGVLYVLFEFIVVMILITLAGWIAILAIFWSFCIAVWVLFSPLFIGKYFKEKHGFGGAVPLAGVILVTVGFLFQLIASFRR